MRNTPIGDFFFFPIYDYFLILTFNHFSFLYLFSIVVIKPKLEHHVELNRVLFAEAKGHRVSAFDKLWIFWKIHQVSQYFLPLEYINRH